MEYLTVRDTAEKWKLSERAVQQLCVDGRIPGAQKFGKSWAIPTEAEKPQDPRTVRRQRKRDDSPLDYKNLLPLMNTPFRPGSCLAAAEAMEPGPQRDIAMAEYHYFSGHPEEAARKAEPYLTSPARGARLSACLISAYANLSLGEIQRARFALDELKSALDSREHIPEAAAASAFVAAAGAVLLHLPLPEEMPEPDRFLPILPPGLRAFALYVQAHYLYLKGAYGPSAGLGGVDNVLVGLGPQDTDATELSSGQSITLEYTAQEDGETVVLGVAIPSAGTTPEFAYGELASAVQFSNAKGFVFWDGSNFSDSHTVRLTRQVEVPDLSTRWEQTTWEWYQENVQDVTFQFLTEVNQSSNTALGIDTHERSGADRQTVNDFITYLQRAKGYANAEDVPEGDEMQFKLTVGSIGIGPRSNSTLTLRLNSWEYKGSNTLGPNMYFLPKGDGVDRVDLHTECYGLHTMTGSGEQLWDFTVIGQGANINTTPVEFDASTKFGTEAVPESLEVRGGVGWLNDNNLGYTSNVDAQASNIAVELTDEKAPQLDSATTPSGTYRPGQLVPVVLSFDELVYVDDDNASITINGDGESGGVTLNADALHMSKAGNQILFWYPVQSVDNAEVTITSVTGITDIFGNETTINGEVAEGAKLESVMMRDAAQSIRGVYDPDTGLRTVDVYLTDNEVYKQKYTSYHRPSTGERQEVPFQVVVTNSEGAVVTVQQVYVKEDGTGFATQPFSIAPDVVGRTYTVTLQANEGTREAPNWVDLSYKIGALHWDVGSWTPAHHVEVTDNSGGNYTLTLGEGLATPILTARVYGEDNSVATYQSGNWTSSVVLLVTILSMSAFFSIHYLTVYYLLQPYTAGTEMKSGTYRIVMILTYVVCYALINVRLPILVFGAACIAFCVVYSVIASILVYKFAPQTFRLRT